MPQPVHRNDARRFGVGAVTLAVLGVAAVIGMMMQLGGALPGRSHTYVEAAFDDVGALKTQQPVTRNGIRIGQVDSIDYRDGTAIVTMRLDGDYAVYGDAHARVGNKSALGRMYVDLDPGDPSTGLLGDDSIPTSQTSDSAALDEALSVFDEQTRNALGSSMRELGGGLAGHSGDLRDAVRASPELLDNLGDISDALSSTEADLPSLLVTANQLAQRFDGRHKELSALLRQMDDTFRAINVDDTQPLADMVDAMPATLRQARQGLKSLNRPLADVHATMATIRPGGEALGSATEDLRGLLREAIGPLDKLPGVSERAVPAVRELRHTMADARPLARRLSRMVAESSVFLHGLSPYAVDIGCYFGSHDLLSGQIAPDKHYFSSQLAPGGFFSASAPDPAANTNPYPEPGGGAWDDNASPGGDGCPR